MNMQMSELMMSSPRGGGTQMLFGRGCAISSNFVHINYENPIFELRESRICILSPLNKCRIMFALIYLHMGTCFFFPSYLSHTKKKGKISKFYIQNIWENTWGDDIINSLICIFISTVQEIFRWKIQKFIISYLPFFLLPIYIKFSPFCSNIFTLFIELT